ncbi:MAG: hypothetical protein ABI389_11075 [Rhodanobacter sp.]
MTLAPIGTGAPARCSRKGRMCCALASALRHRIKSRGLQLGGLRPFQNQVLYVLLWKHMEAIGLHRLQRHLRRLRRRNQPLGNGMTQPFLMASQRRTVRYRIGKLGWPVALRFGDPGGGKRRGKAGDADLGACAFDVVG